MEDYAKQAEENFIQLKKWEEEQNRKFLMLENVIGYSCSISYLLLLFAGVYATADPVWRAILIGSAIVLILVGATCALKIERDAGYYECAACHHRYVPAFRSVFGAMHFGRTRYMKCPKCGKKSWQKKVLTK